MILTLKREIASVRHGAIFPAGVPLVGKQENGFYWVQDEKSKAWIRIANTNINEVRNENE